MLHGYRSLLIYTSEVVSLQ